MAYQVVLSTRFKKEFRRCIKRGLNMKLLFLRTGTHSDLF